MVFADFQTLAMVVIVLFRLFGEKFQKLTTFFKFKKSVFM